MRNNIFNIEFDKNSGTISSLVLNSDRDNMNWCSERGRWGYVHHTNYDGIAGDYKSRAKELELVSFSETEKNAVSVYSNGLLNVTAERFFDSDGNLKERFTFKNVVYPDLFLSEHNCSVELPFNDVYTYADDCMVHRCNTHIWCGLDTTYVNALKMGVSENNLGLVVTKGSFDSYSVNGSADNGSGRGTFLLNPSHFELTADEEHVIEWVIFPHSGTEDFFGRIYPRFVKIFAEHHTVFLGERIRFSASDGRKPEHVRVYDKSGEIEYELNDDSVKVDIPASSLGERRVFVEIDGTCTYADFLVKEDFETILEKRINFMVDKQQYHKSGSALDGAFLIYDNKRGHVIFEDCMPDHNACRERIGMALLITRYLQTHKNEKFRKALDKYIEFVMREFYDEETGNVYGTVGKNQDRIRLYNAPWMSMLFTELYMLTGDKTYLDRIMKLFGIYYKIGGYKFYPNGIAMLRSVNALKQAGMTKECAELTEMFKTHVANIIKNQTSYPKHEVNYEQTIVSPAATYVSEFAAISGEDKYIAEAKRHIEVLERFSGCQPSFHMHEIPIRYWDDYWFGKMMLMGDTFPHYWSCLTARSYKCYYNVSGDEKYLRAAEECIRNCLCLFSDDGRGSAAYVYPYRLDDKYGEFYDDWANDQDFALYFALETDLLH